MSEPSPGASSENLIERSNVPDLMLLTEQTKLNNQTMAGELSGPPLKVDGKPSEAMDERLAEQRAWSQISKSAIMPSRPEAAHEASVAREFDERVLEAARLALRQIPDTVYNGHDHKAASVERVKALELAFRRKWELAFQVADQIAKLTQDPPRPGGLLKSDGSFDYGRLDEHKQRLIEAETLLAGVPPTEPTRRELKGLVDTYRGFIVAGLSGVAAPQAAPVRRAAPESPGASTAPLVRPAAPGATRPLAAPEGVVDDGFAAWCEEIEQHDVAERARLLAALEAEGVPAEDRRVGRLAGSIGVAEPAALTAELAAKMDDQGLRALVTQSTPELWAELPARTRVGIVRLLAEQPGSARAEAQGLLGGAVAASLVRQEPRVMADLIGPMSGPNKGMVIAFTARSLTDVELTALGREALHAVYKAMGSPATDEARRQASRLVRLSQKK